MSPKPAAIEKVRTGVWSARQLTPQTWPDFLALFGKHKGCSGGCWCTYHQLTTSVYWAMGREMRQDFQRERVERGETTGVLCYLDETPVGWCQFGLAALFEQLNRSRAVQEHAAADPVRPVWRITCVMVDKDYRHLGLSARVLAEAVRMIRTLGGGVTEAYPMEVLGQKRPQYTGSRKMYEAEGFVCIAPLRENHFLMRAEL